MASQHILYLYFVLFVTLLRHVTTAMHSLDEHCLAAVYIPARIYLLSRWEAQKILKRLHLFSVGSVPKICISSSDIVRKCHTILRDRQSSTNKVCNCRSCILCTVRSICWYAVHLAYQLFCLWVLLKMLPPSNLSSFFEDWKYLKHKSCSCISCEQVITNTYVKLYNCKHIIGFFNREYFSDPKV